MGRKMVVSFPGGRGSEIPLLYFASKHFEDAGYEKRFINGAEYGELTFDTLYQKAEELIRSISIDEYDDIVFVAKSIGTVVACKIKKKYKIPAKLILFTPLKDTLPYINNGNDILLAVAGENDRYLDPEILRKLCEKEKIKCHMEPDVGHRMEVKGDLSKNLEIIFHVINAIG